MPSRPKVIPPISKEKNFSSPSRQAKTDSFRDHKKGKPEIFRQPNRPAAAPPTRPNQNIAERKQASFNPKPISPNQRNNSSQRKASPQGPNANAPRSQDISRINKSKPRGNPLELVGKPIRRDRSNNSPQQPRPNRNRGGLNRPGMPGGMRKPVSPGELMQLQKPTGRPGSPPPRRTDRGGAASNTQNKDNKPEAPKRPPNKTEPKQQAAAPKRPTHRPGS